jgi:hypothetical protein
MLRFKPVQNVLAQMAEGLKPMSNLLTRLLKPIFRCKYTHKCPHYNPKAFTCNHPSAEEGYCGIYRLYESKSFNIRLG